MRLIPKEGRTISMKVKLNTGVGQGRPLPLHRRRKKAENQGKKGTGKVAVPGDEGEFDI